MLPSFPGLIAHSTWPRRLAGIGIGVLMFLAAAFPVSAGTLGDYFGLEGPIPASADVTLNTNSGVNVIMYGAGGPGGGPCCAHGYTSSSSATYAATGTTLLTGSAQDSDTDCGYGTDSGSMAVSAAYGSVSADASLSATSYYPGDNNGEGTIPFPPPNSGYPFASFSDTLTFHSTGAALGTPIVVEIQRIFQGTSFIGQTDGCGNPCANSYSAGLLTVAPHSASNGWDAVVSSNLVGSGTVVDATYLLNASAYAAANSVQPTVGGPTDELVISDGVYGNAGVEGASALNVPSIVSLAVSDQICVTVLTPGVGFTASSGASYACVAAAPEPASLALLLPAVATTAAVRPGRRRMRRERATRAAGFATASRASL